MASTEFKKAYHQLNPNQKQAVDALEGPIMVLAGPGTGKTQVLTLRIANILQKTDTPPDSILALTFTDSAAQTMRQRLISLIGPLAYKVQISTFHAFASSVIQDSPEYFIHAKQNLALTDLERYQIIHSILDKKQFALLKPVNAPYYYTRDIVSSIQTLKREAIPPQNFKKLLQKEKKVLLQQDSLGKTQLSRLQKDLNKNLDLHFIYQNYQKKLHQLGRYDFEDMISWVISAFQDFPDLLLAYQERFHYFLVDEYQDTNSAQNDLVNLLASYWADEANIFVVGDDEQSIFRFQGASLENILDFQSSYPKARVITLNLNYRSHQLILNASRQLINQNQYSLSHKLKNLVRDLKSAQKIPSQAISFIRTPHQILENFHLARDIQDKIDSGILASQIAVIVRNNADLASLIDVFSHLKLPFSVLGNYNILDTISVKYLLKLFQVIHKSKLSLDDLDLFTLLHYPFLDFDSLDILKLSRFASQNELLLFDALCHSDFVTKTKLKNPQAFLKFIDQLKTWHNLDATKTFPEFFGDLVSQSGLLNWILKQPDSLLHLNHLNNLFDTVKQLSSAHKDLHLEQFLDYLDLIVQNNLSLSTSHLDLADDRVTLTTAHKAKGLEWDHVYLAGCIDGKWGGQTPRQLIKLPSSILSSQSDHDPLEDERRLFYVALTRARKSLTLSAADSYISFGRLRSAVPSSFIAEIDPKYLKSKTPKFKKAQLKKLLTSLVSSASDSLIPQEAEFVNQVLKEFRLSVTALNTYLECPYKFKINNLFRVPKAKEPYLSFGTAIHAALESFHKKYKQDDKYPSKEYLIGHFEAALKQEIMMAKDFKARLHQGKKVLSAYLDFFKDSLRPALFTEKYFGYNSSHIILDDILLIGKIDRIDTLSTSEKTVKLVDYKTGDRKTRGQIEGTTQADDGSYKRQLVFYKLLVDLDSRFPAKVSETQLDFVESPHQENKSGQETFIISKQEVDQLKNIIKTTMKQIRSHKFERTTDYSICHHCDFKDHCYPQGVPQINPQQLKAIRATLQNNPES